jgi:hypothetical protein
VTWSNTDAQPAARQLPHPHLWVAGWLAYSLLALGFFAWQETWLGFMCITR